jgi:hypothetical protein
VPEGAGHYFCPVSASEQSEPSELSAVGTYAARDLKGDKESNMAKEKSQFVVAMFVG